MFASNSTFHAKLTTLHHLRVLLIALAAVLAECALAISPQIHPSPLSAELSQPTVTSIFKDQNGFLWIGTQQGLYKFEGRDVKKFNGPDNSMENADIRGIEERRNGNLVVATFGQGIYEFSKAIPGFQATGTKTSVELQDLHKIADDYFIAAGRSGIVLLNLSSTIEYDWLTRELSRIGVSDVIDSIRIDTESTLIATNNSLLTASISSKTVTEQLLDLSGKEISAVTLANRDEVFVSTSDSIIRRFDIRGRKLLASLDLSRNTSRVSDLLYFDGQLWVATDRGLIIASSDLRSMSHLTQSNSLLSNNYITRLFSDDRVLFVGTLHGLDQIVPNSILSFNSRNSGVNNDVLAFTQSPDGRMWVGTYNGLYVYDSDTGKHQKLQFLEDTRLPDPRITTMASRGNDLWVGLAEGGVRRIEIDNGNVQSFSPTERDNLAVTKIIITREGSVYFSTYNEGIYKIQDNRLLRLKSSDETSFNHLFETRAGAVLATSERQLYMLDPQRDEFHRFDLDFQDLTENPVILTLGETLDGELLIGTKGHGLFALKFAPHKKGAVKAESYTRNAAINRATIYGIVLDRDLNVWCSTQRGVYKIDPGGNVEFRLTKLDGLQGNDFNHGAYFLDSEGFMYFGGLNGYNRIEQNHEPPPNHNTPLRITQIGLSHRNSLDFHHVSSLKELELTYDERSLTIVINLLDYQNPKANQYTHKLQGLTNTWSDASTNNTVTYSALAPGSYTFRARGANAAGVWSENEVALNIVVLPPWWMTWWAFCAYAIVGVFIVWMMMRTYRSHLLKEEALRLAEEMHNAADQAQDELQESHEYQDELVRAVSRHNMATLDLISQCLGDLDVKESGRAKLQGHIRALELLEQCYFFQEGQLVADMHTYVDGITNYLLSRASVDPATITSINRVTTETLPADVASPLAVILYELMHNSMVHAFRPGSHANFIEICLDVVRKAGADPLLVLSVADDGSGDADSIEKAPPRSGQKVIHSLAAAIGASYSARFSRGYTARLELNLPED